MMLLLIGVITFSSFARDCDPGTLPSAQQVSYYETQLDTLIAASQISDVRIQIQTLLRYATDGCYQAPAGQREKFRQLEEHASLVNLADSIRTYSNGPASPQDQATRRSLLSEITSLRSRQVNQLTGVFLDFVGEVLSTARKSEFKKTEQVRCTPVDLRSRLGPVDNQGTFGNCYAYACATLLDFELRENERASVNDITLSIAQERALERHVPLTVALAEGGNCVEVIQVLRKRGGICPAPTARTQAVPNCSGAAGVEEQLNASSISDLLGFYSGTPAEQDLFSENSRRCDGVRIPLPVNRQLKVLETFSSPTVEAIIKKTGTQIDRIAARGDFSAMELSPDVHRLVSAINGLVRNSENMFLQINSQIDLARPLAISVSSHVLDGMGASLHAMVIVGRQWNSDKGTCEYILRNSWGNMQYGQLPFAQEAGNVIIPEAELAPYLHSVEYLD